MFQHLYHFFSNRHLILSIWTDPSTHIPSGICSDANIQWVQSWYFFAAVSLMNELIIFTQSSPEAAAGSLPATADSTDSTAAEAPTWWSICRRCPGCRLSAAGTVSTVCWETREELWQNVLCTECIKNPLGTTVQFFFYVLLFCFVFIFSVNITFFLSCSVSISFYFNFFIIKYTKTSKLWKVFFSK